MSFEPWMLAAMEEEGLMDTSEGCISRVAKVLNQSSNDVINTAEFREACYRSNVDPDSFSQADLDRLQSKLICNDLCQEAVFPHDRNHHRYFVVRKVS